MHVRLPLWDRTLREVLNGLLELLFFPGVYPVSVESFVSCGCWTRGGSKVEGNDGWKVISLCCDCVKVEPCTRCGSCWLPFCGKAHKVDASLCNLSIFPSDSSEGVSHAFVLGKGARQVHVGFFQQAGKVTRVGLYFFFGLVTAKVVCVRL